MSNYLNSDEVGARTSNRDLQGIKLSVGHGKSRNRIIPSIWTIWQHSRVWGEDKAAIHSSFIHSFIQYSAIYEMLGETAENELGRVPAHGAYTPLVT